MTPLLEIQNLRVEVDEKQILHGISLTINENEIHALMGPNGAGKSTLSYILAGHPKYKITEGSIRYKGNDLLALSPDERAKAGLFLAFQYPAEIPGVSLSQFLYTVTKKTRNQSAVEFRKQLLEQAQLLGLQNTFLTRELNVGFSGGEKKKAEILQLLLMQPNLAILDETDSGLDLDSLQIIAKSIQTLRQKNFAALIITHYPKLLLHLRPDYVHILKNGKIIKSGDATLAHELEAKGYQHYEEVPAL